MPTFAETYQLSADQRAVLERLGAWHRDLSQPTITVGGYAGTGKTTLISVFRQLLKVAQPLKKVAFACYTGKASQVLRQKLVENKALYSVDFCGTIHSLLYTAVTDKEGKILTWKKNAKLEYDLIIIDEASMVTSPIWQDLLEFQLPIIAVGDHGQLPPIEGSFNLMEKPEVVLEHIHRQAVGNPIIEVATLARTTGQIPFRSFSSTIRKVAKFSPDAQDLLEQFGQARSIQENLILCGRNKTRIGLNTHIRELRGYAQEDPQVGELLICLRNNYEAEGGTIYNGMAGLLKSLHYSGQHWYDVEVAFLDSPQIFTGPISRHQFNQEKVLDSVTGVHYTKIGSRFDYGYALTVHKSQGSQARRVLLFEERNQYMTDSEWARWLYTGVTRASEELYVVG